MRASAWVSGPATNARHEQGDMGQRPARFVCAHGLSSASPPRPQRDGTQDTKEQSTYSESSPGSCKPSSPVHGDTVQGTTVTWGPGRPPGRYGQEEQGPPGQGTGWHGTRVSCGLGPLRAGTLTLPRTSWRTRVSWLLRKGMWSLCSARAPRTSARAARLRFMNEVSLRAAPVTLDTPGTAPSPHHAVSTGNEFSGHVKK